MAFYFWNMGTVSVYSAMLGPLWYMLCVSHLALLVLAAQKTVDFLQLPVHLKSPISCRSAEADSHGLAFGKP